MDFQDFYLNYLRQQQMKVACEDIKQDENEFDTQSAHSITNYATRPANTTNFNQNQMAMQDESTLKTGFINGINNQKGVMGYTSNLLKQQQKQFEVNNQRVFGRELSNVEQDRSHIQNNAQNIIKATQSQNFIKPMGNKQVEQKNTLKYTNKGNNNQQADINTLSQYQTQTSQLKRHMSVEYLHNPNDSQILQANESNFYSRNSTINPQMVDENQQKFNNSNAQKANTCKASFDKENYSSSLVGGYSTIGQSHQTLNTSRSRNTMDVESSFIDSYKQMERQPIVDYTFPKDKLQKDPIFQYTRTIFDYLRNTEHHFCAKGTMNNVQQEISVKMRAIMVDWLVDVHYKFKLLPETLFQTINLIDRYIERKNIFKDRLQLLGTTSMFIASKFEEIYPPEIQDFVYICDNLYTKEQILEMEGDIITTINFDLTFTSPLRFLDRYTYLNESTEVQYFCAQYLLELALIEYSMVEYSSSNQAASAVYLINKLFDQPWSEELRSQSQYDQPSLKKCAKDMWVLLQKANEYQFKRQKQAAELENEEQLQIAKLKQWYSNEKTRLEQQQEFIQEEHEQLEIEFDTQKKQIDARFKEFQSQLLCNNKNLIAIIRKFSLPKFKETAQLLFNIQFS